MALLTVPEVASRLRVSRTTIYNLIREKHLPAMRVNSSIRIEENDLLDYIDACRTVGAGVE